MNDVVLSSTEADSVAVDTISAHHAELLAALGARVDALGRAAAGADRSAFDGTRTDLITWCRRVLMPHVRAEEKELYPAGHAKPELRALVDGMLDEHVRLAGLADQLAFATEAVPSLLAAGGLRSLLDGHVAKENEQLLPALASAPDVSVASCLERMHEAASAETAHEHHEHEHEHAESGAAPQAGGHAHDCTCGETDPAGFPELDARTVPHAIRHATVFGALDAVGPGKGLVLVAPHDPLPLLAQIERRSPNTFDVDYLQRGPEAWRLAIVRRSA